jgi:hypothetical protein
VEPRRSMRGVTASFGVNLLCCGLHYFHAGAARPGGWVVTRSSSPGMCNKTTETCPSTRWADAGGGSCTDTPRGESCWRSVGPHGECGFDAGGLPARFRKRPRAGALRSAGVHAAQRRSLRGEARRRVGFTLGYHSGRNARECGGTSLVPAIFTKFMTEVCHYAPSSEGALRRGGVTRLFRWIGARCLGNEGGYLRTRDSGRDIPMAVEGGTEANRGITTPRYTLTPD